MNPNIDNARKWFDRFFKSNKINELQLSRCEKITDLRACVSSHITILQYQNQNKAFQPYYNRLRQIRKQLEKLNT